MANKKFDKYFYLGSPIIAFSAILIPVFVVSAVVFGLWILLFAPISETFVIVVGCVSTPFIWMVYLKPKINILYSWGKFELTGVRVRQGFKSNFINYSDFKCVGIAFYKHGLLNSDLGTTQYFIVFSLNNLDKSYRSNINLWNPPPYSFKIKFNPKLYNHLINILPPKQKSSLKSDYMTIISQSLHSD